MGGALDRAVLRQVATATIQGFVNQIGQAVVMLAAEPEPAAEPESGGVPRP